MEEQRRRGLSERDLIALQVQEEMGRRIRSNDEQLDLLRNAVARRDWLLAEQRSAFYKARLYARIDSFPCPLSLPTSIPSYLSTPWMLHATPSLLL